MTSSPVNEEKPFKSLMGWDCEVFLSSNTSEKSISTFIDTLHKDLVQSRICTFKSDNEFSVGNDEASKLLETMHQSKVFIPVFSKDYAFGKWCLQELACMVDCSKTQGQKILPIFYELEASDVRDQRDSFREAFHEHEKNFGEEVLKRWKEALKYVGGLKGWEIKDSTDIGHHERLVKAVVSKVLAELNDAFLSVTKNLVGIDNCVEEIMSLLDINTNDVRIIGIHGKAGSGRTTLSRLVYNQLCHQFQCYFFLDGIREKSKKGIEYLRRYASLNVNQQWYGDFCDRGPHTSLIPSILQYNKVLIVLDDVDDTQQLHALVDKIDYYALGSRIIVTAQNKQILDEFQVSATYELTEFDSTESLQLFCKHAFRSDHPLENFSILSKDVVSTIGGLPLTLQVIGSFLHNQHRDVWEDVLKKLRKIPEEQVQQKLMMSFEALDDYQKQIFLDIACFFNGFDKAIVSYMWDSCGLFPEHGIGILVARSLLTIDSNNHLQMHDEVRHIGQQIVHQESVKNMGMPSRLWCHEEALDVLKRKSRQAVIVKGICLDAQDSLRASDRYCFTNEKLQNFLNLNFFRASYADFSGDFEGLLPELRWLHWRASKTIPENFCPKMLAILDLSYSGIIKRWKGWTLIEEARNLKVLNLSFCRRLTGTPKFPESAVLERLILRGCENLADIDASIRYLKNLVILDFSYCKSLEKLPQEMCTLKRLETLNAKRSKLMEIPSSIGEMTSLKELELSYTCIAELPCSVGSLHELRKMSLAFCGNLIEIPESIGSLRKLQVLSLECCSVRELPQSLGELESLAELNLKRSSVEKWPNSIGSLKKLRVLDASGGWGTGIQLIPGDIGRLLSLRVLRLGLTGIHSIPLSICKLSTLKELDLHRLELESLPELPSNLTYLRAGHLAVSRIPNLSELKNLETLVIDCAPPDTEAGEIYWDVGVLSNLKRLSFESDSNALIRSLPVGIGKLSRLQFLSISHVDLSALPEEIGMLSQLQTLDVSHCSKLQCLPVLPCNLHELNIWDCESMEDLGDLSNLKKLSGLRMGSCELSEIRGLSELESLREMNLHNCNELRTLNGLERLTLLRGLSICNCSAIRKFSDLSNLGNLKRITHYGCQNSYGENIDCDLCLFLRNRALISWKEMATKSEPDFWMLEEEPSDLWPYLQQALWE